MLKIIEVFDGLPAGFPVDPDTTFQPGQLAQFYIKNNRQVVGLSDGTNPCGILDDIKDSTDDSTKISGRVTVWFKNGIYLTDLIERNVDYKLGNKLYFYNGRITSSPHGPKYPSIGHVFKFHVLDSMLEFTWLERKIKNKYSILDQYIKDTTPDGILKPKQRIN